VQRFLQGGQPQSLVLAALPRGDDGLEDDQARRSPRLHRHGPATGGRDLDDRREHDSLVGGGGAERLPESARQPAAGTVSRERNRPRESGRSWFMKTP